MPNWCCNALKVTGFKKDLDAFKATLNSKEKDENGKEFINDFSFKQTVPPPTNYFSGSLGMEEKKMCAEKGLVDWYSWNTENWGTKWDACEVNLTIKPKSVEVRFDTAWAPPLKWLENASKAFPNLKFHMAYCEGGMGFYGEAIAKAGGVSNDCADFPKDTYDEDSGEVTGEVRKFVKKWGIGTGG